MSKTDKGQKKVCSVWLEPEITGSADKVKMFYCFNCKMPIVEYQGDVINVIPGRTPYTPGTIAKCKGNVRRSDATWEECGMYYCFQGTVYTKNPHLA